jgi:hypothetical protein
MMAMAGLLFLVFLWETVPTLLIQHPFGSTRALLLMHSHFYLTTVLVPGTMGLMAEIMK